MILKNVLLDYSFNLYADDTVLYNFGLNAEIAASGLQVSLDKFSQWCSINKPTINTRKTKVMSLGSRNRVRVNRVYQFTVFIS